MELLATQSPVREPAQPLALPDTGRGLAVRFEHVDFHYPSRPTQAALQGFDLELQPGETVALVGASGAGKTTVFQLLQRFYDVDAVPPQAPEGSGRICVEGIDLLLQCLIVGGHFGFFGRYFALALLKC